MFALLENNTYISELESLVASQSEQIDLLKLAVSDALAKIAELQAEILGCLTIFVESDKSPIFVHGKLERL